jgi:hypothetical protein
MKKTLLILAVFTFGATAFSQIPNYVPQNGLVGWWPFNGNANDESGNGNNGTVNGATLTADRNGISNAAYYFSSVGCATRIDVSVNTSSIQTGLTVAAWVMNVGNGCIGPRLWEFYANDGPGQSGCATDYQQGLYGIGSITTTGFLCAANIPMSSNNIWSYIVYSNDGSIGKFYKNGQLLSTVLSNGLPILSGNGAFGRMNHPANDAYNGNLDDIGIWNRALTECEIQDLYHAQLNSASQSISAGADQSICAGDNVTLNGAGGSNYQWNNNVVDGQAFAPTQSNAYVLTAQDSLGCTGIDTVVVTVLENATSTLTETALDSYTLNGQTYTQSGTYTQTLTAANGCDSTITLNLTLNFTGIDELGTNAKKLVNITDLNGKTIPRRKNTLMLFIYEEGTVERVVEIEE